MKTNEPFKLWQLISPQLWVWMVAWLLGLLTVWSVLGLSMVSGWFVTMSAVAGLVAAGSHAFNYMVPAAVIRTFAIIRTLSRYGDLMVSHHAVFGLLKQLRVRFFESWARLDFVDRNSQGQSSSQKMHRLVKDIDVLNEFVLRFISPWVMAVGSLLLVSSVVLWVLPQAWYSLGLVMLCLLIAATAIHRGKKLAESESQLIETRKAKLLDTLPALTSLLIWHRWDAQADHLKTLDETQSALTESAHRLRHVSALLIQICLSLSLVLLLWAAGLFLQHSQITPFAIDTLNQPIMSSAVILAVFLGMVGLSEFIQNLVAEPLALGRSQVAKQRLNDMLQQSAAKVQLPLAGEKNLALKLDEVSVKAPNALIGASGLTAHIGSDRPCLVVGPSGAGKSTLLQTLAGEHALISGSMQLINDGAAVDWQTVDFGNRLGFLGQTVDIFDQTLADNLRIAKPDASDDELYAVLERVNLSSWLQAQPKGLATALGEYGMAVSGGQARRIALARLLLSPKAVLLLDEPFAGLDALSRQKVWQSLVDAQRSGQIGILMISTHQLWHEMGEVQLLNIEPKHISDH
ncbi:MULTISPECIES: amino acid ABC transporter ATP-binding/permease protein [Moraxella]|uniref:Cysteine ABC transporter n=1 Tax=Moraxella porci DSM 25326 TaxID=573983 RepID=A0A1T0CWF4_9GAMM|nr:MULTISPECIES: ATP-binding cassette domain-containing protein [Moraxella]OOS26655.1 cysteine ABC transporter [Moraxella porci DSM 25326]PNP98951.1 cysteine ABC transporter [Moraxella sp. RCAD0137]